jgi:predicted molibdopterin-dependent oxidoreductase YjgC
MPKDTTRPDEEVKTICTYCGVGCQMYLGVKDGKITGVRGDPEGPANQGRLCVKGRFGIAEFVNSSERLKTPLIRKGGELVEASWDEALALVAEKFKEYHSDEIGLVSSAKATNEDNYVMQKFGRAVLGTNNIDHCARL